MLELSNQTIWSAGLFPGWDPQRQPQLTAVFKASFDFDEHGQILPAVEQSPLVLTDEYHDDSLNSSLKEVQETAAFKKGSEFYLYGTAFPEKENLIAMEVGVGILFTNGQQWKKVLRVFGERRWKKSMLNYQHDDQPHFVTETPLRYEYAFGGRNPTDEEDEFLANPVGMGYNSDQRNLVHDELPLIEIGPDFIVSPMQKPIPAGFGPLPVWWEPRMSEMGMPVEDPMDQAGCPYAATAKDTLHNVAPLDQRFTKTFQGGEIFHLRALLKGVSHQQTVEITLPQLQPQLYTIIENQAQLLEPVCDTVVINTDDKTLSMIFRAGIPWRMTDRRKGWVVLKDLDFVELPYDKESKDTPRMAS